MHWYYVEDGKQAGPITEIDLKTLVRLGTINDKTLVWHEGLADWKP